MMKSVLNPLCRTTLASLNLYFLSPQSIPTKHVQMPYIFHSLQPTCAISVSCISSTLQSNLNQTKFPSLRSESSPSALDRVRVLVSPMFAGKTTTLLERIKSGGDNGSFQGNTAKNFVCLDKTLKELCLSGRITEAVGILCRSGVQVRLETYSLLLQECIFRKAYKKGRRIHWQMFIVGFIPNEYLKIKLLILYAKSRDLSTAHILFDKVLCKDLISWNAMISGYVQMGLCESALSLYNNMRRSGLMPDQYTFSSIFRALASLAMLEQGRQAHALLIKSRISGNVVVHSALMDMYFKCSSLADGHLVFDKCLDRNVITWSALISGYGQHGRVAEVLESFERMTSEGFRPNNVTFLAVLSACSHRGLVNEGWKYFTSMLRDHGIQPRPAHYAAMVDLLGRAGRLEEAYKFVKSSPCVEHPVLWGALLWASKMHRDMDMAKLAARNFFEFNQENADKYIVLSNTYASFGLWGDVAEIRSAMKNSGMRKEPGYSMIEFQRETHFFFMGHNTHGQSDHIYELINNMICVLRDADYVSDCCI